MKASKAAGRDGFTGVSEAREHGALQAVNPGGRIIGGPFVAPARHVPTGGKVVSQATSKAANDDQSALLMHFEQMLAESSLTDAEKLTARTLLIDAMDTITEIVRFVREGHAGENAPDDQQQNSEQQDAKAASRGLWSFLVPGSR